MDHKIVTIGVLLVLVPMVILIAVAANRAGYWPTAGTRSSSAQSSSASGSSATELYKYSVPKSNLKSYYYDNGIAGAVYCGNKETLSIDDVADNLWASESNSKKDRGSQGIINMQWLNGKLSKQMSALIRNAVNEYNIEVGDIYSVQFTIVNPDRAANSYGIEIYQMAVQIETVDSSGHCGAFLCQGFSFLFVSND